MVEAEEPPTTIEEWQERVVRLNRNQRQSRMEEKMLGRNMAHPGRNAQSRGGYGGGLYGGREGQITWRMEEGYRGEGGENIFNRGKTQMGPRKDPNAIDIDRRREGNRMYYVCGKWGHMAKNYWERHKEKIVEML